MTFRDRLILSTRDEEKVPSEEGEKGGQAVSGGFKGTQLSEL